VSSNTRCGDAENCITKKMFTKKMKREPKFASTSPLEVRWHIRAGAGDKVQPTGRKWRKPTSLSSYQSIQGLP
jgi:hypothetical protein